MDKYSENYPSSARSSCHTASSRLRAGGDQQRSAPWLVDQVSRRGLLCGVLNLTGAAVLDAHGQAYRRLLVLGWLTAVLLVLGCVLGVVWRVQWPHLPELPIPTTLF